MGLYYIRPLKRTFLQLNKQKFKSSILTEKETQKGKYKNPKVQKSNRCEIVKSINRFIKKIEKFKYAKDVKQQNPIIELFKNLTVQIFKRCEIVKSNNRIIQKSKSSNMQKM